MTMKILSCNLRGFGKGDGEDAWVHRKELCIDIIKSEEPDIISFQEMQQINDISNAFDDYETYGMIDEPFGIYPLNSIFYRKDAFICLAASGYFLSETPHVLGSKSWNSDCVRFANWILLKCNATGTVFRVINTHLDDSVAREEQAKLIVEDSSACPEAQLQILTGDMNCDYKDKTINIFKVGGWEDTYSIVHGIEDPGHTFHEFKGEEYRSYVGKIDWIFVRGKTKVVDATLILDSKNGRFPSDHYFLSATLNLGETDKLVSYREKKELPYAKNIKNISINYPDPRGGVLNPLVGIKEKILSDEKLAKAIDFPLVYDLNTIISNTENSRGVSFYPFNDKAKMSAMVLEPKTPPVKVNILEKSKCITFLHSTSRGKDEEAHPSQKEQTFHSGKYIIRYENGETEEIEMEYLKHITCWNSKVIASFVEPDIFGSIGNGIHINIPSYTWINPFPDRLISEIEIVPSDNKDITFILYGMSIDN